ncbi:hypothetical protein [Kordia sp.]|uniref:hypothetical protein n=1 Tax=Kordia sp. TaxID=1965332 RepID=UPI003D26E806
MKKKDLKNLRLNKKSISALKGGKAAPSPVSVLNICNTGCDSPVHTCGIVNCNLTRDLDAPM